MLNLHLSIENSSGTHTLQEVEWLPRGPELSPDIVYTYLCQVLSFIFPWPTLADSWDPDSIVFSRNVSVGCLLFHPILLRMLWIVWK